MTVPTTGPSSVRPRVRRALARMYSSWSPSTQRPRSSTITTRSPSPSSARPTCARTPGTVSCSNSGAVEPQPSLMLRPFGEQPIGTISAPRSASTRGATL